VRILKSCPAGLLGFFLLAAGCSSSGIHPVSGEVVYPDGSPAKELQGCRVIFEAVGADGKNYSSEGEIDAEGKYQLTTTKPGDGAPLGKNRVVIERKMLDSERVMPRVIEEKFENFDTSGLEFEVKEGTNHAKLTLTKIEKKK